ncbi:three-helix bundle dimerization domain-containing protein [Mycobacterium sp. HM-7]
MTRVLTDYGKGTVRDTVRADWVAGVAAKLTLREGRHDIARDMEITRWCREAAMQFADARIQAFVPLLVERIVGDRIRRERRQSGNIAVATEVSALRQSCRSGCS